MKTTFSFFQECSKIVNPWKQPVSEILIKITKKKLWNINYIRIELHSTVVGCNVWMSSFTFNRIIYDPSGKMQLRDATLLGMSRFINILLTDATDKSKISRDHYRILFDVNLIPPFIFREHSFSAKENIFYFFYLDTMKRGSFTDLQIMELFLGFRGNVCEWSMWKDFITIVIHQINIYCIICLRWTFFTQWVLIENKTT